MCFNIHYVLFGSVSQRDPTWEGAVRVLGEQRGWTVGWLLETGGGRKVGG